MGWLWLSSRQGGWANAMLAPVSISSCPATVAASGLTAGRLRSRSVDAARQRRRPVAPTRPYPLGDRLRRTLSIRALRGRHPHRQGCSSRAWGRGAIQDLPSIQLEALDERQRLTESDKVTAGHLIRAQPEPLLDDTALKVGREEAVVAPDHRARRHRWPGSKRPRIGKRPV